MTIVTVLIIWRNNVDLFNHRVFASLKVDRLILIFPIVFTIWNADSMSLRVHSSSTYQKITTAVKGLSRLQEKWNNLMLSPYLPKLWSFAALKFILNSSSSCFLEVDGVWILASFRLAERSPRLLICILPDEAYSMAEKSNIVDVLCIFLFPNYKWILY